MAGIIIASAHIQDARKLKDVLNRYGYSTCIVCQTMSSALNRVQDYDAGIVICTARLPDGNYADLYNELPERFQMILLSGKREIEIGEDERIVLIRSPFKIQQLMYELEAVVRRLEWSKEPIKRAKKRRSESERQIIESAKLLLMEKKDMSEPEAHRYIQKISMNSGVDVVETAQKIILTY
ncbi:ANTAR domain-containing response regulator [Eubacterium xylanophilum]|uniref:ANTAR domain-containing response regulator n=1 Tax=Eubacterium xylanophilum TaxID=39497 RepID=UPI00047DA5BC|nr:ANTAR domain-containing protein [Eubacterium xylanophilum]